MANSESNPLRNRQTVISFQDYCNNNMRRKNGFDMTFSILPDGSKFYVDKYGNRFEVDEVERQYPIPNVLFYNNNTDTTKNWWFQG